MRGSKAGSLGLPRYNSDSSGGLATSPTTISRTGSFSPPSKVGDMGSGALPAVQGDSILDIEGGDEMEPNSTVKHNGASWWHPGALVTPMRTTVFSNLGSAVSSGWSKARGAMLGSSITSYIRRVPTLDKPFDLKDTHPGESGEI